MFAELVAPTNRPAIEGSHMVKFGRGNAHRAFADLGHEELEMNEFFAKERIDLHGARVGNRGAFVIHEKHDWAFGLS